MDLNNGSGLKVRGWVKCVITDPTGKVVDSWEDHNLVTTAGLNFLAAWLTASTQSTKFMPYVALGSGSTSPDLTDVALGAELARLAGDVLSSGATYTNTATFGPDIGTGLIAELGLFSASSGGTMFSRHTFTPRVKASTNTVTVVWSVVLS